MSVRNWFRLRRTNTTHQPACRPHTRLGVQQLEDRAVPADLLSGIGVGGTDLAVDSAGNSYLAGYFSGTKDFDPSDPPDAADTLTAQGTFDGFVAKYAPDNSLTWVRQINIDDSTSYGFMAKGVDVDAAGNVYVTGTFKGTASIGSISMTSAGDSDGYVAKLNSAGTVQWAKRWGGTIRENGQKVDVDAAGNVYVLGTRETSGNFGYDVLKFTANGASSWTKSVNSVEWPTYADLAVSASGSVYIGGIFSRTVDFDPGTKTKNVSAGALFSGFVLNLTSAGNFGWVSPFVGLTVNGTSGASAIHSLTLDPSGNVIVGGRYGGTVDFNPGSGTTTLPTGGGAFIAKLTSTGALTWARAFATPIDGSAATTTVYGLATDSSGAIYASGGFGGTIDLDPGSGTDIRTSASSHDAYVMKLNSSGNYVWGETFGGTSSDIAWGVAVSSSGTVYLTGTSSSSTTVDWDPDPNNVFNLSGPFFIKLQQ